MIDLSESRDVVSSQQLPVIALEVNLDPSTLPGPFLRRNFRFRGAAPGDIPQTEQLPRFIGVAHDDEGLSVAKRILEGLPKGSRVGLEFDEFRLLGMDAGRIVTGRSMSFTALGDCAEAAGLTPILIERPSMMHPAENQHLLRSMAKVADELTLAGENLKQRDVALKKLGRLQGMMGPNRGCDGGSGIRTSAWRSELMARYIACRGGWRSSDVVIVGTAHALNLASIFNTRVSIAVGRYLDQGHFEEVMRDEMRGQAIQHRGLNRGREWHRSLHTLTQPLRSLVCPNPSAFFGRLGRFPKPSNLS